MKTSEQRHFSFNIPDTVLFLNDKPICWIFTNKEGNVKKKNSEKLNNEEIYKYFVKKSKSDILCSYAYSTDENKKIELIKKNEQEKYSNFEMLKEYFEKLGIDENYDKKSELIINNSLKFEFYDKSQLKSFLNDKKKYFGILQRYVESNSEVNFMYRIFWSPKMITCEMRRARQPKRLSILHPYERAVTFESDKFNSFHGNLLIISIYSNIVIVINIYLILKSSSKVN